ncbi:MAG: Ig-like domain repeat protein [Acidobacteriaceae bacterium]|nr:Ig-like domain repeat protein [Acidobacteriaceae bacterium]
MCCGAGCALAQTVLPRLPAGIAYDAAGNLYLADAARNALYESTLAGELLLVAGGNAQGFGGDGGPATAALLNQPQAVAVAADGTLYLADTANQRVRSIDTAGLVHTVAGSGVAGFSGDGGAATQARVRNPVALATMPDGSLLIADAGNHRIRRLQAGTLTTFAGNGEEGFGGDGGPATNALLDTPEGVAVTADGRVLIADSHNHRLRVVSTDGTISTLAGTGQRGYAGDGGAAVLAKLSLPRGVAVLPDGRIVFADADNQRLRVVATDGTISTLVGSGVQGDAGEGSGASLATVNSVHGVAISPVNGAAAFADSSNRVVRALLEDQKVFNAASMNSGAATTVSLQQQGSEVAVQVQGNAGTPVGAIQVSENGVVLAAGTLRAGAASIALQGLSVGTHSLVALFPGDGFNPAASSLPVGFVVTDRRATVTTMSLPGMSYQGLPLTLVATVSSASGTPTGTVTFLDGSSVLATSPLSGSVASTVVLAPVLGTHVISASYSGDTNFLPSSTNAQSVNILAAPSFTLTVHGSDSMTVAAGTPAGFQFDVAGSGGAFTGAVSLSVAGLPSGTLGTFSPAEVIPGAGSSLVTLTIPTAQLLSVVAGRELFVLGLLVPLVCLSHKRRAQGRLVFPVFLCCFLLSACGCGARTLQESTPAKSYTLTVTATGTDLLGAIVSRNATIRLSVR